MTVGAQVTAVKLSHMGCGGLTHFLAAAAAAACGARLTSQAPVGYNFNAHPHTHTYTHTSSGASPACHMILSQ